jgi:hypothetical protein
MNTKQRCFISGKITGQPFYKIKFAIAYLRLWLAGYQPVTPTIFPKGWQHEDYIHVCKALIDTCDAVYFLKDWKYSKGARIEWEYALSLIRVDMIIQGMPCSTEYLRLKTKKRLGLKTKSGGITTT